jgi:lipopolysaccharide export system ATP-binding protein
MEYLATDEVVKIYNKKRVVNKVSIEVKRGEVVGLLGPNGAGKTTVFYMVVGIIRPDSGRILLNAKEITDLPMYERARGNIGYLAQEPSIFRTLSVEDNIMAILEFLPLTVKQRKEKLEKLLDQLSIQHIRKKEGQVLSGGERRRVEIARALATEPKFILLDEPFAGVDPIAVNDIQEIISMLKKDGLGILITDHNVRETLSITDRSYILNKGEILISGDAQTIANSEEARKFYLGDKFSL